MAVYRVRLYRDKKLPYEVGGICAENEKEASDKAKEQIARNGYWGNESTNMEERMNKLTVENVILDNR